MVHFACLIAAQDPKVAAAYAQAIEKMAATIRPNTVPAAVRGGVGRAAEGAGGESAPE